MTDPIDKVKIIDAIRRLSEELGHAPSRDEFRLRSGISDYQVLLYFHSWRDALHACGLEPNRIKC